MVEPLDDATRRRFQRQRRRDTRPEIALRSALHRQGLRFRVDAKPIPTLLSRADIVFGPARVAVFVDGCFWHSCPEHGSIPKNNRSWWVDKLASNVERDRRIDEQLRNADWVVLRFWAHEDPEASAKVVLGVVTGRRRSKTARG